MTVYADILFLVNFSMDLLTVYLTGKAMHRPIKPVRCCFAGVIGGAVGTAETLFFSDSAEWTHILLIMSALILSVVMTLVAFGKQKSFLYLLRDSVILWGAGALLGGIMTLVLSLGEPVFISNDSSASFAAVFFVCFFISSLVIRMFTAVKQKKSVTVNVSAAGEKISFSALVDSGNIALEPLSGLPVVIVSEKACAVFSGMTDSADGRLKIRAVPVKGIGGERVLMGFVPERITLGECERRAVVAIDKTNPSFGGCDAVVPSSLV